MALIGYARVSTTEQHLHLQQDALHAAGCLKIFTDTISGAKSERKGLLEALDFIRAGDILVVWRLDRLGRSLKDLIERITDLYSRNIGFKSLTENIDTTTSGGKLIFHIFGALAEFRLCSGYVQKPVTGCNAIEYNTLQALKLRCVNRCLDRYANRCPKKGLPKDATTPLILKDLTDQKSYPERSRFLDARRYDRILHVLSINPQLAVFPSLH